MELLSFFTPDENQVLKIGNHKGASIAQQEVKHLERIRSIWQVQGCFGAHLSPGQRFNSVHVLCEDCQTLLRALEQNPQRKLKDQLYVVRTQVLVECKVERHY